MREMTPSCELTHHRRPGNPGISRDANLGLAAIDATSYAQPG